MVNYAILTMDPPHLLPDTLQTHGEQLSFILQMGFISRIWGISEVLHSYKSRHKRMIINAAENDLFAHSSRG